MLKFRFTCPRHQALFIEILRQEDCGDPVKMDEARRMLLSWLSEKYPLLVLEHFAHARCIACEFEAAGLSLDDVVARLRDLARELKDR